MIPRMRKSSRDPSCLVKFNPAWEYRPMPTMTFHLLLKLTFTMKAVLVLEKIDKVQFNYLLY